MKKGFSLIELLISLIVISLIISAFMPILSSRLKHREITLGGAKVETKCFEKFNEKCMMCNDTSCILCTNSFSCPYGQYCDAEDDCKCKSCSAIYPNCTKCNKNYCESCIEGYKVKNGKCEKIICEAGYYLSGSECLPCVSPCATCTSTQCLSCINSSYKLSDDKKTCILKEPCIEYNAVLVENSAKTIRFCMKKRNAGDALGPSSAGTGCKLAPNNSDCITDDSTNSGFNYSACPRTLCNWNDGNNICKSIGWELPTNTQLDVIKSVIAQEKKENASKNIQKYNYNGLALCDNQTNAKGSPKCKGTSSQDPECIWSKDGSSNSKQNYCLNSGVLNKYTDTIGEFNSVRCVKELL